MNNLDKLIKSYEKDMISTMSHIIPIKAVSPMSGGGGESKRADYLEKVLRSLGLSVKRYSYKDKYGVPRPNLVAVYGDKPRTIWIVPHMDTVSEGDPALWKTPPFKACVTNGKIYGRGSTDNLQALVSSIYALKALKKAGAELKYNFGLAIVADEEIGSVYGIQKLLKEHIFKRSDMFIVPDCGDANGNMIEVAEKGILWVKITVNGKQVHASTPDQGVNAHRYMLRFLLKVDELLHRKYTKTSNVFSPNISTFEMTKHEKNVDSINIIPGTEIAYIDCRVLPDYKLDDVLGDMKRVASGSDFSKVKISFEIVQREDPAPPTSANAEVVRLLKKAIKSKRGVKVKTVGIGGGTCAGFLRRIGLESAVWSTVNDIAHRPNEYLVIKDMVDDAKVFAELFV